MIIAMRVKTADEVKGSKNLRCYTFEAPNRPDLVVVANLTNVYQVGDVAAVAQVGTVLPNGLEIITRKVFGIESSGMALGPIDIDVGSEVGEDLIEVD